MKTASSGYYDEAGIYYTNSHRDLQIHVSNYKGDDVVDMYFDNVNIYPNSFCSYQLYESHHWPLQVQQVLIGVLSVLC